MCGIVGILNMSGNDVSREILNKMNQSMYLRGPDDEGSFIDKNFGMSMRRLSIIDLEGGAQPIYNENKTLVLMFNGEIYNHIELRKSLELDGHIFKTNSDSEVIIHLYEKYGDDLTKYLNGMFAISIWDIRKKKLFISRDRLGIKPLFYFKKDKTFCFASTLNALKFHPEFPNSLNKNALLSYFSLAYVPSPNSIWKNCFKLRPGHYIIIQNNKIVEKCYWKLKPKITNNFNYIDYINQTRNLIENSIQINARSDVPIGTFLSGGLDSSFITSNLSKIINNNIHTFSAFFPGKKVNEDHLALQISKKFKTYHHKFTINEDEVKNAFDELIPNIDEPISDSALIPSYLLSKLAYQNGVKVILSGAGGDELYGGYARHYFRKRDLITGIYSGLPLNFIFYFSKFLGLKLFDTNFKLQSKSLNFALNTSGLNLGFFSYTLNHSSDFIKTIKLLNEQFQDLQVLKNKYGFSYGRMITDINNYLVDDVLSLTDKSSMAASVETRVPLLDHRLVEKAFSIPEKFNIRKINSKFSLRKIINEDLPSEILNNVKTGFDGPITYWFENLYKEFDYVYSNIRSPILNEIFDRKKIYKIWKDKNKRNIASEFLFMIFIAEKWLRFNE